MQEFQTVKERSRQDSYRHLKRSVIARLGLARLPKTSSTTLGQALVPAVALALPRSNLCQLRASPFFNRSLTASQRSSLVPDDFRILPATTAIARQRQSLASSCEDQRLARTRTGSLYLYNLTNLYDYCLAEQAFKHPIERELFF
jgi:hypothetical protein